MTETPETLPELEMPTIIMDTDINHPNTDTEMAYLKKKTINDSIHHKLRKKNVYETDMHSIYNIIVVQTNKKLQENATLDATFWAVKTGRYPIVYLIILNKI